MHVDPLEENETHFLVHKLGTQVDAREGDRVDRPLVDDKIERSIFVPVLGS